MSSITLIEKHGTVLPPVPMAWRDGCVFSASPAVLALAQGGMAALTGFRTVTDHQYLTRTGSSSCSPPV